MPMLTNQRSRFLGGGRVPPDPVPVAGAEQLINGGMELDDASWANDATPTINERSSADKYSGTYSRRAAGDAAGDGINQYRTLPQGYVRFASWHRVVSGSLLIVYYDNASSVISLLGSAAAAWTQHLATGRNTVAGAFGGMRFRCSGGAGEFFVDDASVVPLTLASLLSTRAYGSADCDLSAAITRTAGTQAGLCARLDSATSPANFIIAYLDGAGNVKADKCVAGTYTNVITGAVTYAAGRVLRLVCSGNNVSCYYNGTQVGSTVTVSDAGIASNTRHGKFSTYGSNVLANYVAA